MATEIKVEAVVTSPKPQIEVGGAAAAAAPPPRSPRRSPSPRRAIGGASHNETANNDTMVNGDLQLSAAQPKEEIFEDPPLVKTDRFGFTGGKQFTEDEDGNVPVEVIRRREIKWLDMLDDWEKWMTKKPKKVRERCRKGIPSSIRSRAWQYLCGSWKLVEQNKNRWKELDEMEGQHKWVEIITKDLNRQFPFHEMFCKRGGHGQQDLFRMLKAYSLYNPRDGYCQGQAPVAAVLLMHMPVEDLIRMLKAYSLYNPRDGYCQEQAPVAAVLLMHMPVKEAFWCFVQVCDKYLTGYYSPGLEAVQVDGEVLQGLMKRVLPITYKHMAKHKVEPILFVTEWFMCVYARTLPWKSVLRVWDMFLCEGVKVIFRVALVLLKHTLGRPDQMAESEGLYEIMEKLKNIPPELMDDELIYQDMVKLNVFEKDMEAEHSLQVARRQVIKQRQTEREGQSTIMSRDIEAIQQRQKNEKKRKAEGSPKKGGPLKNASKKSATDSSATQGVPPPPTTILSVKPADGQIDSTSTSNMQDTNGTSDHRVPPPQGENGTPHHRVPPPLPPGVVLEDEEETGKGGKKKSKKEKEKQRLKEMKQKEKEERQKHKAQFKTNKEKEKENKEKEKAEKAAKEKERIKQEKAARAKEKADKEKAKAEKARLEKEKAEKAKAEKAAKEKEKKSSKKDKKSKQKVGAVDVVPVGDEKEQEPQEKDAIQGGASLQTLEMQKEEYVHLSDPKEEEPSAKEGNGHVVNGEKKPDNVTVPEVQVTDEHVSEEQVATKEASDAASADAASADAASADAAASEDATAEAAAGEAAAEEQSLPGVRRIEVQEAADPSTTDNTVEEPSAADKAVVEPSETSSIPTETDIDAATADELVAADPVQSEEIKQEQPAEDESTSETSAPQVDQADIKVEDVGKETPEIKVEDVGEEKTVEDSDKVEDGGQEKVQNSEAEAESQENAVAIIVTDADDEVVESKSEDVPEEATEKQEDESADGKLQEAASADGKTSEKETHIDDDPENVVVEDLDGSSEPKGVTSL